MLETILRDVKYELITYPVPEVIGYGSLLLTSLFFIIQRLQVCSNKQLSYILSLSYSFALAAGSIPFIYTLIINKGNLDWANQPSNLGRSIVAFFATGISLDLILGFLYYPKHLHISTGWIHHIFYIFLMMVCLVSKTSEYFCLMCPIEIPTFIMGLGIMFPHLRSDFWFGITFFSTRVLYHTYSLVTWYFMAPKPLVTIVLTVLLPLHLFWFRGFILQQQRIRRAAKKSSKADAVLAKSDSPNALDSTGNDSSTLVNSFNHNSL